MISQAHYLNDEGGLFSIVSQPDPGIVARDLGVVILNSGTINNVGPFGLAIAFAQAFTQQGIPVLRLDQSGKGESADAQRGTDESATLKSDVESAQALLTDKHGVDRIVIVGLCSGADQGMQAACLLPRVAGLVMLDGWAPRDAHYFWSRYLPKLMQFPRILSQLMAPRNSLDEDNAMDDLALREALEKPGLRWNQDDMWSYAREISLRKIPLLALYTGDSDDYYSYAGQLRNTLSRKSINCSELTEVFEPDRKHLYPIVNHQEQLVNKVTDWLLQIA